MTTSRMGHNYLAGIVAALLIAAVVTTETANAATVNIVPTRASGSFTLGPGANDITLGGGGQDVEVLVFISGFDPQTVAAYQGTIDCLSLDSNIQGKALAISTDCTIGAGTFGVDYCLGVDETNASGDATNYLLASAASTLPACQNSSLCPSGDPGEFACGAVAIFGDSGADNGSPYYGMHFAFSVTADMKGTISVGLDADPNKTFLKDPMAKDVPITGVTNANIIIPVGRCCGAATEPLQCGDNYTEAECNAVGGGWTAGEVCSGVDTLPGPPDGLDDACPICDVDSDCDDGDACTADTCTPNGCVNTDTTPAGQCCNPGNGALTTIDDGDPCTDDVCAADGSVSHPPAAAGTACDDGNGCTALDECDGAGGCAGTDINTIPCTDISECPAGSQSCEAGSCVCTLETKMDLVVAAGGLSDAGCHNAGDPVTVDVTMGAGSECVTGGQFLVNYDPSCLSFEGLAAGAFFPMLIFSDVDEAAGTIFAAVGVMPGGGCTQGPEVLATLSFSKMGACGECNLCYDSVNPQNTILSNDVGNSVPLTFNCSSPIRLNGDITLNTPSGDTQVNPDCDTATAVVTWDPISASDSCDAAAPDVVCDSFHSEFVDISGLIDHGGLFPQGISSFTCTATNSCGDSVTNEWTVTVSDQHALEVQVQLSPVIVGDPLTRCVCFDFYSDCVQAPTSWCTDLNFGFPYDFPGHWRGELKVPKGQYACITAKDPLHTLRSVSAIDCVDNHLVAEFKGDPTFDGNWLINGNLDAWKADGNGDTIDILDFGMFISQFGQTLDPNSPCGAAGPHSDINGDGVVDGSDFAFISQNFLDASKNSCCADAPAGSNDTPLTSVTVKQLRRMGLGELVVADLNNDGVVDTNDMQAFMDGATPQRNIKRGVGIGGTRSSLGR